jgi:hypothetical protein
LWLIEAGSASNFRVTGQSGVAKISWFAPESGADDQVWIISLNRMFMVPVGIKRVFDYQP